MNIAETNQIEDIIKIQKSGFQTPTNVLNSAPELGTNLDNMAESNFNKDSSKIDLVQLSDSDDITTFEYKTESEDSLEVDILQKDGCESLLTIDGNSLSADGELNENSLSCEYSASQSSLDKSSQSENEKTSFVDDSCDSVSYIERLLSSKDSQSESLNGIIKNKCSPCENESLSKAAAREKVLKILKALENNDVSYLVSAAMSSGGLVNDDIRRKVWPKLVGVDLVATSPRPCQKEIEEHPYYQQVVLDVNRSLKRFPPSIQEAQRLKMLDQLVLLIMRVLCKHPELHYYQGYHDICVTFLLVLGEETAYHVVEELSRTHLRVFMEKTMDPTIHLLENMYLLIGKRQPKYQEFLLKSEVGVAYCLSWLITWFSHVLNDYKTVVRMFDFFVVSHHIVSYYKMPKKYAHWMPMYATAALVLYREPDVIKQDCDMASVHSCLSRIPDDLPFEDLLNEALNLFKSYTPKTIDHERPYVKVDKRKRIKKWSFFPRMKYVPTTLVIAAAVLMTAVIYQAFSYKNYM